MSAGMSEDAMRIPKQHMVGGRAQFLEPFPCFLCGRTTRPPGVRRDAPGMEGTRCYGGRGCCTSCYQASRGKRRQYNQPAAEQAFEDIMMEHTRTTLQAFLERRRQRLAAGSTAVPQRQLVGAGK